MILEYDTPEKVATAAAATVAWIVASKPQAVIGLAGGTTPAATYRLLAAANLDWSQTTLFLGDERWVPHDHEDSNTRMIRETLGTEAAARLLAPDTTADDPQAAAADYTERVGAHLDDGRADLVLLGMGSDGHTVSLFPGSDALQIDEPGFAATWVERLDAWRLTATLPLLCRARSLVFIVTGIGKAAMMHRMVAHDERLPAQRVAACDTEVTWLVDAEAASHLS